MERHPHDQPQRERDRDAVEQGELRRALARQREPPAQQVEREAAETPAEQRDRDRDERVVVPDRRREDAGEPDLEHQAGQRDEEDSQVETHGAAAPPLAGGARRYFVRPGPSSRASARGA